MFFFWIEAMNDQTDTYYLSILKRNKKERRSEENRRARLCLTRKLRRVYSP